MSIQINSTRYAIVICSHMEVPLIHWQQFNLEETIHYFSSKAENLRINSAQRREIDEILKLFKTAKGIESATLETLYQREYELFMVFSFENYKSAKEFESAIPAEAIVRYGLAMDVPMLYRVHFQAASIVSTENNFKKSTLYTANLKAKQELTDAKKLLNHASFSFKGVQIETMYQYHTELRFVFSFESKNDREAFRLSLMN